MSKLNAFFALLVGLVLAATGAARAQSVTISPTMPSVALGKSVTFTKTVTGLSNLDVIWSAGGTVGGNATAGTITTAGVYTAPAVMPAQNPVLIKATSKINATVSATTYVNLLTAGPKLTSVTPNPLVPGTVTVTLTGTGFQQYASVVMTYGTVNVQMSDVSVTPTQIVATSWLGSASSASFTVRNPGSDVSNAVVVPVGTTTSGGGAGGTGTGDGGTKYTLSVVNGSGGGSYSAGATVTITANTPPAGQAFSNWTGATVASATSSSTTLKMPAANTTVTANYVTSNTSYTLTVVNGTGSGSYKAGTVVPIAANAPVAGQFFSAWTGATVASASSASTTLTMPAANATVTATYMTPPQIPFPVTSHPRLWITPADLPRLQGWANANNPVWKNGIAPLLATANNVYTTQFFPNGVANPNYPDPGDTQGYSGSITEEYAIIFALDSLVDPVQATRIQSAQRARNLIMYAMNLAALGHLANAPFRDPMFAVYNRANANGEQWPLVVDWIYNAKDASNNPILTAQDKLTIRKVFMMWANDCLNASTTGGDHPAPIGVTNSTQILSSGKPYRMASNNYYLGHARILTLMSLCMDPSDDPAVDPTKPVSTLGNSMRSYILNANGAWLYQEYAMMGDGPTVAADYNIPGGGAGFGLASGGLPPEGMLYGHSFGFLLGQLLALQTAGFNNVALTGPQAKLINAPVWDRYVKGFLTSLTPTAKVDPSQPWMGPVYQYGSYGDLLRLWCTPDFMEAPALLALVEQQNGQTTHRDAARWFAVNGVEGGAASFYNRISQPFTYGSSASILYFLLMDPSLPAATDPRPSYPTTFVDVPAGRIVSHTDWSASGTMFDYRSSWISINHQLGDGGQFELFRNGEWLTKEMSNYDNNAVGLTSMYHNTLALQNWSANGTPQLSWFENGEWLNGSEWMLGQSAGDPVNKISQGQGYIYADSDLTKLFNHPDIWAPNLGAADITKATRSILWLDGDFIVVYDRATSVHSGLFKRFNLALVTNPTITGNVAKETLASGQQLFVTTLLPANATISAAYAASNLNPIAQMEPTRYILTDEDTTRPADVRFLHVLQGADASAARVPTTYVKSTAGTAFDGAAFGSCAVYFPVSATASLTTTTLPVPIGSHTVIVAGLTPDATYNVSLTATAVSVAPSASGLQADSAGLLTISF